MDHDRIEGLVLLLVGGAVTYFCLDRLMWGIHRQGLAVLWDRRAYLFGEGRRRPKSGFGALLAVLVGVMFFAVGLVMTCAPRAHETLHVTNLWVEHSRSTGYVVVTPTTTWSAPESVYATMQPGGTYRCTVITLFGADDIEHCP